jgi:hypothetical protein
MSDPGAVMIFLGGAASSVAIVAVIANTVIKLKQGPKARQLPPASAMNDDRMMRLEAAVESIAIEVERISEGQRFTTRLLSENSHRVTPPRIAPGKFDTPH